MLKAAYKNASDKKTFVWTLDEWRAKCGKVLASKDRYFLITKDPITMKSILVDDGFDPGEVKTVIIGPCNDRPGATKLGNNQAITQPEADALEAIMQKGYEVEFALKMCIRDRYFGRTHYIQRCAGQQCIRYPMKGELYEADLMCG